jgi:hypothetical protein
VRGAEFDLLDASPYVCWWTWNNRSLHCWVFKHKCINFYHQFYFSFIDRFMSNNYESTKINRLVLLSFGKPTNLWSWLTQIYA